MQLYENTLIGTFLYGLGIEIGVRAPGRAMVSGVDLLQQTPLDSSIGDLIIKAPRYFRVIEFKRASNRDDKEAEKRAALRERIDRQPDAAHLLRTGAAIHLHIEIDDSPTPDGYVRNDLAYRPYLGGAARACSLRTLCAQTADAMHAPSPSPTPGECARYLSVLKASQGAPKVPTGGGGTLLVAMREGVVEHAHVGDLTDLFRSHRQLRTLHRAYELLLQRVLQAGPVTRSKPEKVAEREQDLGDDHQL